MGRKGPACGWALAYVEEMMAEYRIPYAELWSTFPVVVGFALRGARAERYGHSDHITYSDRQVHKAQRARRAELEAQYEIIEPAPEPETE